MKIIVIGAVAGGATAAARMRRLSEEAEILLLERGEYVSFANCGLPYYIGGVITRREALFVSSLETIRAKYGFEIRTRSEVLKIDRDRKTVEVKNLETGQIYEESYDKLILSTGSSPFIPPMKGIGAKNIFTLWTIADTDRIWSFIKDKNPKRAVVVGGGFIGIEMVENLVERGIDCTLVELTDQIMPPFDRDMTVILEDHMRKKGVRVILGSGIESISDLGDIVNLSDGSVISTDMTLLCIGVRPNNALASQAGLALGPRGHIVVDEAMRTTDPHIYAVGDVVEVDEPILGGRTAIPLAGPANRQGRFVCANVLSGQTLEPYPGTIGTNVAKIFDMTAASTGMNEKQLIRAGLVYGKDYFYSLVHPMNHVTYYPGALPMVIKLIFSKEGLVLGAQIAGYSGVDKRIDVIATAMHFKGTVRDLAELELAYAPPYGAAKDPVNFAGFVAENILAGLTDPLTVQQYLENPDKYTLLDIREEAELVAGTLPGAVSIPLSQLRERHDELDKDKTYLTFCAVGLRGYVAERMLKQYGFDVCNLLGGLRTLASLTEALSVGAEQTKGTEAMSVQKGVDQVPKEPKKTYTLDVCGMSCPGPIVEIGKYIREMQEGERVEVRATDPGFARDIASWCENTGNTLLENTEGGGYYTATIRKGGAHEEAMTDAASSFT
ncbi:MAG TPA: FAD-dependent oxidoreductase, partial [Clostridia bacterium]|nr:FAD-dependent oxidoreductase [Clostridia bacterium]